MAVVRIATDPGCRLLTVASGCSARGLFPVFCVLLRPFPRVDSVWPVAECLRAPALRAASLDWGQVSALEQACEARFDSAGPCSRWHDDSNRHAGSQCSSGLLIPKLGLKMLSARRAGRTCRWRSPASASQSSTATYVHAVYITDSHLTTAPTHTSRVGSEAQEEAAAAMRQAGAVLLIQRDEGQHNHIMARR